MSDEIGWQTIVEADSYFLTRLSSDAWTDEISGTPTKTAALQTAYDRLYYSGLFDLPDFASATAAELIILRKAQCEMALYMLIHLADEDRRKGLQAQGVVQAGIVKETYSEKDLMKLPIPPLVAAILGDFSTAASEMYISSVDRDEDEEDMEL